MKNRKLAVIIAVILTIAVIAGVSVYAASNYGTSSDPLITLSYLNDTLAPKLLEQFRQELDSAVSELQLMMGTQGGQAESYKLVTLSSGQRIVGQVGCEIMLRIGTAKCSAQYSPGLVDVTTSGSINNGTSLTANHLYMVTIEGHGITATAATVKVLVRGSYSVV